MQSPPTSILVSIGGFDIHYYGLIMFCAIICALFVIRHIAKKYYRNIDTDVVLDILPPVIISAILGARLYYVLMDFGYFYEHPTEILALWHGGMSIHGGIIGGVISGFVLAKIKKISFLKYADVFSYGLVIGQAIGRFGNYFNCEAFGKPCFIPYLQLYIPEQYRPYGYETYEYFHPTFLYESLWDVVVFLLLFFVIRKVPNIKDGTIFCAYLIMYSIGRMIIESCRLDSVLNIGGIEIASIVSAFIIVVSFVVLFFLYKKKRQDV